MKWKLVYMDRDLGLAWRSYFQEAADVEVVAGDICEVPCDALVSPANSFGCMDGSLDLILSEHFGWHLQERLQALIATRPARELLVGEALVIPTDDARVPWLISAPTMRVPMLLRQTVNPYLAMKAILNTALAHAEEPAITTVAIPGLGTGCGGVPADVAALQMWVAYTEVMRDDGSNPTGFAEAQVQHARLNPYEIDLWNP